MELDIYHISSCNGRLSVLVSTEVPQLNKMVVANAVLVQFRKHSTSITCSITAENQTKDCNHRAINLIITFVVPW